MADPLPSAGHLQRVVDDQMHAASDVLDAERITGASIAVGAQLAVQLLQVIEGGCERRVGSPYVVNAWNALLTVGRPIAEFFEHRREIVGDRGPEDVEVDGEVVMHESVAYAGGTPPRHIRV